MITTAQSLLIELSDLLKESTPDYSGLRLRYIIRSIRRVLSMKKFQWSVNKFNITLSVGVQEYDITAQATDYSPIRGIYEVWAGTTKIDPIHYDNRGSKSNSDNQYFYLKPDDKTIGFTKTIVGDEIYTIHYYAILLSPSLYTSTLNIAIPDEFIIPIALFGKHLVHEGKRQRYDSRNALLDFKQAMDELIPISASAKIKDAPKNIPKYFSYLGFRRQYQI